MARPSTLLLLLLLLVLLCFTLSPANAAKKKKKKSACAAKSCKFCHNQNGAFAFLNGGHTALEKPGIGYAALTCESIAGNKKKDFEFIVDYQASSGQDIYFGIVNTKNLNYGIGGTDPDRSCWYLSTTGNMYCYTKSGTTGTVQAPFGQGDKITVRVTPGVVSFLKNGVLLPGSMGINTTLSYYGAFFVDPSAGWTAAASCL